MQINFNQLWKKDLGLIYKEASIDRGKQFKVDIYLKEVKNIYANYKVNNKHFTDSIEIVDIENNIINVPFRSSVLEKGKHELEIIAVMKNGNVLPSSTFTYTVNESLENGEPIEAETNYPVLINLINSVEDSINSVEEAISKIPSKEELTTSIEVNGNTYNHVNGIISLPDYPSIKGLATENYVKIEIAKAQLGGENNEIDLSGYATKDDLSTKADKSSIPTKISELINDTNFISGISIGSVTTLEPGAEATVTRRGSDVAPIFDFGIPRGEKGEQGLTGSSYDDAELRRLIASLTERVEELEKGNTNPPTEDEVKAESYCGQINFKSVEDITIDDLENLANLVEVVKPQTVYAHSGSTVYNKTLICAMPKAEGIISSVVDGAGVDITASYPITEKTLNGVVYSISCNKVAQAYNKSTVVKFNIN